MKRAFAVIVLAILISYTSAEPNDGGGSDAGQQIRKLEEGWAKPAHEKDVAPLETMLAEDYALTTPQGQLVPRDEYIGAIKDGTFKLESAEYDNLKVRTYGDAAVVTGRVTIKGTWGDADVSGEYAFTDTFIKKDGKWQEVAGQVTRVQQQ